MLIAGGVTFLIGVTCLFFEEPSIGAAFVFFVMMAVISGKTVY